MSYVQVFFLKMQILFQNFNMILHLYFLQNFSLLTVMSSVLVINNASTGLFTPYIHHP
jgi:hypothetical protein